MSEVRMAQRDASWYGRPDVWRPKVYHVIVSPPYAPACNTSRAYLSPYTESSVDAVPIGMRCQRLACRNRWSAAPSIQEPSPR